MGLTPFRIVGIDPGAQMGWSTADHGRISGCGLIHVTDDPCSGLLPPCEGGLVVIERPVFRHHENEVDPNDLIVLGIKVGRIYEVYATYGNRIMVIPPTTWKGSVPKKIQNARTEKDLWPQEKELAEQVLSGVAKGQRNNVWDALGITIWALKRERLRT